jgi:hypothetical protein
MQSTNNYIENVKMCQTLSDRGHLCDSRVFSFYTRKLTARGMAMKTAFHRVLILGLFILLTIPSAVTADNVTRFNFTQPNFTGGGGNSLFDVAVVEQRGGGEYLRDQGESLELSVQGNALDVERKKVGLENDKVILENNKVNLESNELGLESKKNGTTTSSANGTNEATPQTVYNVEHMYENTVNGENVYLTNEETAIDIDNSGNLTYNQDAVTNTIETGEYNDIDIATETGDIEQNPTSNMNVLIESGN